MLITQAIVDRGSHRPGGAGRRLLALEGMDRELALELASRGIVTREDLAEQAVDDLGEIDDRCRSVPRKLIMAARAHWFDGEQQA